MVLGGLTEWLRSRIGNAVRCNSPVGSSPMSSARKRKRQVLTCLFLFLVKYNGTRTHEWVRVSHPHFARALPAHSKSHPVSFHYMPLCIFGEIISKICITTCIFLEKTPLICISALLKPKKLWKE